MGMGEKGGKIPPGIFELLIDISLAFEQLQVLRKDYRAALPELQKLEKTDMDEFLLN